MCSCNNNTSGGSTSTIFVTNNKNVDLNKKASPIDCDITLDILQIWMSILNCIKESGNYTKVNLAEPTTNQFLGIFQSAINYPDDYCYYINQLDFFRTHILPNIIQNAPECINQ